MRFDLCSFPSLSRYRGTDMKYETQCFRMSFGLSSVLLESVLSEVGKVEVRLLSILCMSWKKSAEFEFSASFVSSSHSCLSSSSLSFSVMLLICAVRVAI